MRQQRVQEERKHRKPQFGVFKEREDQELLKIEQAGKCLTVHFKGELPDLS